MTETNLPESEVIEEWARKRTIEDVERQFGLKLPKNFRRHKRLGFPKSKYYQVLEKSEMGQNRKKTNKFLSIEE